MPETKQIISAHLLDKAMTYEDYMLLIEEKLSKGESTGGHTEGDKLVYSKLNLQRMKRLNKTISLLPLLKENLNALKTILAERRMSFLVLTEGWCGDAAQNLPLFHKLCSEVKIELKLLLRDQHLELMDQFLTNGGRSIPKLIALNSGNLEVLGTWGPRPAYAQQMLNDFKQDPQGDYKEFSKQLQLWYTKDKTQSQQMEIIDRLKDWVNKLG